MRIGIFIDNFFEPQKYKDPGVIAESLLKLGHQVTIYCFNTDSQIFNSITIKKISKRESKSILFWKQEQIDSIILYSWLSLRFSILIKTLKSAGKKIILKLDSDGHLIYPLKPTYLRTFGRDNSLKQLLIHVARLLQWSIFSKMTSKKKLNQLYLSDAAIIESPLAKVQLEKSLKYWKYNKLIEKIFFVPDPVSPDLIQNSKINFNKKNIIICIGRWDDKQKNKTGLIKTLNKINLTGWKIIIIGDGSIKIKQIINKNKKDLTIDAFEKVDHHLISEYLKKSKIFFAPSNHESFNIATAEALCYGCSLAGTPLESFHYFSKNGQYGTISKNFKIYNISLALVTEITKWNKKQYNPSSSSKYWREQLSPETVSIKIENILKNI